MVVGGSNQPLLVTIIISHFLERFLLGYTSFFCIRIGPHYTMCHHHSHLHLASCLHLLSVSAPSHQVAFRAPETLGHYLHSQTACAPYTHKCDIWGVGVVLFTCVMGHFPFDPEVSQSNLSFIHVVPIHHVCVSFLHVLRCGFLILQLPHSMACHQLFAHARTTRTTHDACSHANHVFVVVVLRPSMSVAIMAVQHSVLRFMPTRAALCHYPSPSFSFTLHLHRSPPYISFNCLTLISPLPLSLQHLHTRSFSN